MQRASVIRYVLRKSNGNVTKAAGMMQTPISTFYDWCQKLGIDPDEYRPMGWKVCGEKEVPE